MEVFARAQAESRQNPCKPEKMGTTWKFLLVRQLKEVKITM